MRFFWKEKATFSNLGCHPNATDIQTMLVVTVVGNWYFREGVRDLAENYPNRLSDPDKVWQQLCLVCVRSAGPVAEHELPCNSNIQNTTVSLSRSTLAPRV